MYESPTHDEDVELALETEPAGISVAAILSALGGLMLIVAFFIPTWGGAYWFDDTSDDVISSLVEPSVVLNQDEAPAGVATDHFEASRLLVDQAQLEPRLRARTDDDTGALRAAVRGHELSSFSMMRTLQVTDYESRALAVDDGVKMGARLGWTLLAAVAVGGLFSILLAGVRGFRRPNALQVAWAGLFGALVLGAAALLTVASDTHQVAGVMVDAVEGPGLLLMMIGAGTLWFSAFAGLDRELWWKAPVVGTGLLIALLATTVGSSLLVLT